MRQISCLLLNVRSIKKDNAVDTIHAFAKRNEIHILCLVVTWLTKGVSDAELSCGGAFSVLRRDRVTRGRGILVLVQRKISCTQILRDFASELIYVDIQCEKSSFRLMVAYSPNTGTAETELEAMETPTEGMEAASDSEVPSVILGDFNSGNNGWFSGAPTEGCSPREKLLYEFDQDLEWEGMGGMVKPDLEWFRAGSFNAHETEQWTRA